MKNILITVYMILLMGSGLAMTSNFMGDVNIDGNLTVNSLDVVSGDSITLAGATFENEDYYTSINTDFGIHVDDEYTAFLAIMAHNGSIWDHANIVMEAGLEGSESIFNILKNGPIHPFAPNSSALINDGTHGTFVPHEDHISWWHFSNLTKDVYGNILSLNGMQRLMMLNDSALYLEDVDLDVNGNITTSGSLYQDVDGDETGLVFDVPFEQYGTDATQYDRSPSGITLTGSRGVVTSSTNGKYGSGGFFNSDSVEGTTGLDSLPSGSDPRTIEVLFKPTTNHPAPGSILRYGRFYTANQDFGLTYHDGNLKINTGGQQLVEMGSLSYNEWHHVVLTYDGTNVISYVDGEEFYSNTLASINTVVDDVQFGLFDPSWGGWVYHGYIDYGKIYDRVLSADEARTHYLRQGGDSVVKSDSFKILNTSDSVVLEVNSTSLVLNEGNLIVDGSIISDYIISDNFQINNTYDDVMLSIKTDTELTQLNSDLYILGSGREINFMGGAGGSYEGIKYKDSIGSQRFSLHYPGSDIVALANQAANGSVQIRANTFAGIAGEVISAIFEDDNIQLLPNGGNVGIGTVTPSKTLDVNGSAIISGDISIAGGLNLAVTKTAIDMTTSGQLIIGVTDTSSLRTIDISSADIAVAGRIITIKDESAAAGTNNIWITTEGTEYIDGASIAIISASSGSVTLYSDGSNLFIIGKYK